MTEKMAEKPCIKVTRLPSVNPGKTTTQTTPSHWVGSPPKSFVNPWESFRKDSWGLKSILQVRYGKDRNFVPIPADQTQLVQVRKPDWGLQGADSADKLKATWLGHAGFLVEFPIDKHETMASDGDQKRGVRVLMDTVFANRMSPFSFIGPKRFRDIPCTIESLPEVDILLFSHNHYDHMDVETIRAILRKQVSNPPHILTTLNNKKWFMSLSATTIADTQVSELDWWDSCSVSVPSLGCATFTCLPSQHNSGRGIFDHGHTLWSSWAMQSTPTSSQAKGKNLYFAGDTAYKSHYSTTACPIFEQIGKTLGPFDLALLPIGCYSPRQWMSNLHASPEDSLRIHDEVRSRKSIGMHYGVIRGGLSSQYEDVREPPRLWREAAQRAGKWDSGECGLLEIGETVKV